MGTQKDNRKNIEAKGPRLLVFGIGTALYIATAALWIWWRWPDVDKLAPNAVGDLTAGIFSPLAFLWLLYAALAQKAELELQRHELVRNNQTQDLQQAQMRRQADALDAQVGRLQAQAAAEYAPILMLNTSAQGSGNSTIVHITNRGAPILNVVSANGALIHALNVAAPVRGNVIPHWPRDVDVQFELSATMLNPGGPAEDRILEIILTRLDLQHFRHRYIYSNANQRLILQHVTPVGSRSI